MTDIKISRLIKFFQILLLILLLACTSLLVISCNHSHKYESEITKQPTCTETGTVTYKCSCGNSYTEELPMANHDLIYGFDDDGHWEHCKNCSYKTSIQQHVYDTVQSSVPATCHSTGISIKSCICGRTSTEILQMTEHSFTVWRNDDNGHWLKCADCNQRTEVKAHNFNKTVSETQSTCTTHGSKVTSCECGKTHIEEYPFSAHSYTKTVFDDNMHWLVCDMCNGEKPNQTKIAHNLSETTVDPDCVKEGSITSECSDCDYRKVVVIKPLGHDPDKTQFASASTGSGHYYKCSRCQNNVAEPHILVDCDCPDGNNREATCYKTGHQDRQCEVCGWHTHDSLPMTNDHNFSEEWTYNGTFHWHVCLNGDGKCTAKGDEAQHVWKDVKVDATCTENGRQWRECSECGAVQSGSNKTLPKLEHDYRTIEVLREATCTSEGLVKQRCSRCNDEIETVTEMIDHDMSQYESDINGHYRKCAVCGYTQTTLRNHTWIDDVKQEATCTTQGLTTHTCKFCKFTYDEQTTKNHHYITDPESYVDPTCTEYGSHKGTCEYCGDVKTFIDAVYADHILKEYPAKDMTETTSGNIHYWQCKVCNKYFSSKDCHEELTEGEVFTYPPTVIMSESIAKLQEFAASLSDGVVSENYYQITAKIEGIITENNILMIGDETKSIYVTLIQHENSSTLKEKDSITLKGKLIKTENDIQLTDCRIISVQSGSETRHSLYFTVTEDSPYLNIYMQAYDNAQVYMANTNNYNCLIDGEDLTFNYYDYARNAVLQKVIVNGKSYTATGGTFTVTVTEDIHAEFVFDTDNYCSVTLREIDTSNNNGNAIVVDEYVSYTYTGYYNEYGRLYSNSHLTFKLENANVTGINIVYDANWLADNPEVLDNTVNAIKANGVKVSVEQGSANGKGKVIISLSAQDAYTALEYFANASQARVAEIIVLYQTNNTF